MPVSLHMYTYSVFPATPHIGKDRTQRVMKSAQYVSFDHTTYCIPTFYYTFSTCNYVMIMICWGKVLLILWCSLSLPWSCTHRIRWTRSTLSFLKTTPILMATPRPSTCLRGTSYQWERLEGKPSKNPVNNYYHYSHVVSSTIIIHALCVLFVWWCRCVHVLLSALFQIPGHSYCIYCYLRWH